MAYNDDDILTVSQILFGMTCQKYNDHSFEDFKARGCRSDPVEESFLKGRDAGVKMFNQKYLQLHERSIPMLEKSRKTCLSYANDDSVKVTKSGKKLTEGMRNYYLGVSEGLRIRLNDHERFTKKSPPPDV